MSKHFLLFIVFLSALLVSSSLLKSEPVDTTAVEQKIASAFGAVQRNEKGVIIGVDLARERASANDDVLKAALLIPNLKRFRFAGGSVTAESLAGLKTQQDLEELYLQDVPISDAEWIPLFAGLPQLTRLTLRRIPNLSDAELGALPRRLPALRNLAMIEMEQLTGKSLAEIAKSESLVALDVRLCGRLSAEDYRCLVSMPKLVDLKIGGFAVIDEVLTAIAPLQNLRGLTIDDALLTKEGFEKFAMNFASAEKLEMLVLSRNGSLFDDALTSLTKFPNLKRLTINGLMTTGTFLERLADDETTRPKLQRLSLRNTFLTEEAAAALKKYPELRILDLSGIAITSGLVDIIVSLEHLEELVVTGNELDEESLRRLKTMESLKRLIIP